MGGGANSQLSIEVTPIRQNNNRMNIGGKSVSLKGSGEKKAPAGGGAKIYGTSSGELAKKDSELQKKEAEIAKKEAEIAGRDKRIDALKKELGLKEDALQTRLVQVKEGEGCIENLRGDLDKKDSENDQLKKEIGRLAAQLCQAQSQLFEMQS